MNDVKIKWQLTNRSKDNYIIFWNSLYDYDKLRILMLWQTLSILAPCPDVVAIITRLFMENMTPGRWAYSHMTE